MGHDANSAATEFVTCRGSYALGTACGRCERCKAEQARLSGLPGETKVDRLTKLTAVLTDGRHVLKCEIVGDGSVPDIIVLHNMAYVHTGFDKTGAPTFRRKSSYNAFNKTWWKVENWE